MHNFKEIALLILEHSINWLKYTHEELGIYPKDIGYYNLMFQETNAFFSHLYLRELHDTQGDEICDKAFDYLFEFLPERLTEFEPDDEFYSDVVRMVKSTFKSTLWDFSRYPLVSEDMHNNVIERFITTLITFIDPKIDESYARSILTKWAVSGMNNFYEAYHLINK
ncbi:MAG: hypothetical protein PHD87_01390 [Candidatus Cloacimonetes bacterium]|nr:hypothetical protein [Candidatus Cloacimonadota bacterium]